MRIIAACLLLSCSSAENFEFTTDRTSYAPGDRIEVELRSNTNESVYYGLCVGFSESEVRVCAAIAKMLRGYDRATGAVDIKADARAGEYTITTDVERVFDGERIRLTTNAFTISE